MRKETSAHDQPSFIGPRPAALGCRCLVCEPPSQADQWDARTIESVLRHGWSVVLVSDQAHCEECARESHESDVRSAHQAEPAFAYTVGLGHRAGHPEVVMSGLPHDLMHQALNRVADRILNGLRLEPGDLLEDVLGGVPVAVEQVSLRGIESTASYSGRFHRTEPRAFMLVWPTTSGVFAWQPGAPRDLDELQPLSWREPFTHTGAASADPEWLLPIPPDRMVLSCAHVVHKGAAVLWAARQSDSVRTEDWSAHCGDSDHADDEIVLIHASHLVRGAPSIRQVADLEMDHEAWRDDVDGPWHRLRLEPEVESEPLAP